MRMPVLTLLVFLLPACASLRQEPVSSVEIKTIMPRYIAAEHFVRIDEYLTSRENTGNRVIVRTQAQNRGGFYFVLVLDQSADRLPRGTRVKAEVVSPESAGIEEYDLELPAERPDTKEIFVGLTGSDWPSRVPGASR